MKRKQYISVLIAAVFICYLVFDISHSLWFLHGLIDYTGTRYSVGYHASFLQALPENTGIQDIQKAFIPDIVKQYSRFTYVSGPEKEYIAGIPKIKYIFSIRNELERQSWSVRRIGWVVVASKGKEATVRSGIVAHALRSILKKIGIDRLPLHPVVIGSFSTDSQGDTVHSFYAEKNYRGLHGVVSMQGGSFLKGGNNRINSDAIGSELTFVSLQRELLPFISKGFMVNIEHKISESMHFKKTQPNMLTELLHTGHVLIAREGESFALGVVSNDDTQTGLIKNWMNAEQGTRHPIKKAFSLPDKTLGYEYIPGASSSYFNLNKGKNSCFPSEAYDEMLFLCGKDTSIVFSNEERIGNHLTLLAQDSSLQHRGVVQGRVLQAMGMQEKYKKIEYAISDTAIEIWADVKSK